MWTVQGPKAFTEICGTHSIVPRTAGEAAKICAIPAVELLPPAGAHALLDETRKVVRVHVVRNR